MDGVNYVFDAIILMVVMIQPVLVGLIVWCLIEVKAMQKSTHSIQYIDPKLEHFEKMTEEVKDSLTKDLFDNVN